MRQLTDEQLRERYALMGQVVEENNRLEKQLGEARAQIAALTADKERQRTPVEEAIATLRNFAFHHNMTVTISMEYK